MGSGKTFAFLALFAAFLVLAGCTGDSRILPQSTFVGGNPVFYENGQIYFQTQAYLNTPLEIYASTVPGFNGVKLADGQYANATGKVKIQLAQTKRECVYPLVPQTGYVGGLFGLFGIQVTEFIPQNSQMNIQYDVKVNDQKVASGTPFTTTELSVPLPYNAKLAQTPVLKIQGQDAGRGSEECPAAGDFVIIRVEDTATARIGGVVGQISIRDKAQYFARKNDLSTVPLPRQFNMNVSGLNANANTYTFASNNLGSGYVIVKVPQGAFNIITFKPPAEGRAQFVGECKIQDAKASQQTNLEFTYKNIGDASIFQYAIADGKYVYASGDRNSGTTVASGETVTVRMRVTPNANAEGTSTLPISVGGESGISAQITCFGTVLKNDGSNPAPLPQPGPGPIGSSNQCKFFEKPLENVINQETFLWWKWGGTPSVTCAPDLVLMGGILTVIALLVAVLGILMYNNGLDTGILVAALGGLMSLIGSGILFLGIFIDNANAILFAGIGVFLIAVVALIIYLKLSMKI